MCYQAVARGEYVWKSEDNLFDCVLSFHQVGAKNKKTVFRFGIILPYLWNHLSSPVCAFSKKSS